MSGKRCKSEGSDIFQEIREVCEMENNSVCLLVYTAHTAQNVGATLLQCYNIAAMSLLCYCKLCAMWEMRQNRKTGWQ